MTTITFARPESLNKTLTPCHIALNQTMLDDLAKTLASRICGPGAIKISAKESHFHRSIVVISNNDRPAAVYLLCTKKRDPMLGSGSEHEVRMALDLITATVDAVAIRRFNTFKAEYAAELRQSQQGLLALRECQGAHIVPYRGHYEKQYPDGRIKKMMIFMGYCRLGSLEAKAYGLPLETKETYSQQLISAVKDIHDKGWVHADIKPENVVLESEGQIRLIDFACASKNHDYKCGSTLFIAPEILSNAVPSRNTDLWSLGCTLFYLWSNEQLLNAFRGRTCWTENDARETLLQLNNRDLRELNQQRIDALIQEKTPQKYHLLLQSLLNIDPLYRK